MELIITAEFRDGRVFLTVEHGNAEQVQVLDLTRAELLAAMAVAQLAIGSGQTAAARYPKGLRQW